MFPFVLSFVHFGHKLHYLFNSYVTYNYYNTEMLYFMVCFEILTFKRKVKDKQTEQCNQHHFQEVF